MELRFRQGEFEVLWEGQTAIFCKHFWSSREIWARDGDLGISRQMMTDAEGVVGFSKGYE